MKPYGIRPIYSREYQKSRGRTVYMIDFVVPAFAVTTELTFDLGKRI